MPWGMTGLQACILAGFRRLCRRAIAAWQQAGLAIHDLTTQDADLEDLFLELTRSRAA